MLLYDSRGCIGRCAPAPARLVCLHLPSTGTSSKFRTHIHADLHFSRALLLTTLGGIEISDFDLCIDIDKWSALLGANSDRPHLMKANYFEGHTAKFGFTALFICPWNPKKKKLCVAIWLPLVIT
jgi:hypothetical protein